MAHIYIKTKQGRVAFSGDNRPIPHDKFVPVPDSAAMRRLINYWQDVEVQGETVSEDQPHAQAAPAKESN